MLIRNLMYDLGIFNSTSFDKQVISVGNLSVGGTGKTPHIEYITRLLHENYNVCILSRGYKRQTSGFILADSNASPQIIGDEPFQMAKKFNNVTVAVDEKRVRGIKSLLKLSPEPDVILLDDAFQHRAVDPGLNILLTDYHRLYTTDFVVPSGGLREFRTGVQRADIIVVTKTPALLSPLEKRRLREEIRPETYQKLYFSYVNYGPFVPLYPEKTHVLSKEAYLDTSTGIVLVTGIATTKNLTYYLRNSFAEVKHLELEDHHNYTQEDLKQVAQAYRALKTDHKLVLMTEKDAVKWINDGLGLDSDLPMAYMPIEVAFHKDDNEDFDKDITQFVKANTTHQRLNERRSNQ